MGQGPCAHAAKEGAKLVGLCAAAGAEIACLDAADSNGLPPSCKPADESAPRFYTMLAEAHHIVIATAAIKARVDRKKLQDPRAKAYDNAECLGQSKGAFSFENPYTTVRRQSIGESKVVFERRRTLPGRSSATLMAYEDRARAGFAAVSGS
jgi:hypothetical protein